MATVCPNIPAIIQDPRFQKIKEIYKYKNWSDFGLAVLLKCYREDSDLDPDFYPETEEELMGFADFLNRPNESSGKLKKEDINNLYKTMSTLFQSPKQLNQRLDLISRWFTDALNKRQKEHPGLSRQQVLSTLSTNSKSGFQVIMEDVFKQIEERSAIEWQKKNVFDYWHPNATEEEWETARKKIYDYRAAEFKKLVDNKDFLSALAAPKIGAIEGIAVKLDGMTINIDTSEEDYEDDFEGQEDNGVDQSEAQKGDRYVDFRVLSLMSTLSTEAKQMLRKLYRRNPNGTLVRDDLGYTVPVDIRQITLALHRVLRFTEPKTLMEDLQKASTQYPDIRSLIMHLKENPDDATLVYTTFKKSKVNYYYGYKGSDGKLTINKAGNIAEGYALASEAGANISSGLVSDNEFNVVDASGKVKDLNFFERKQEDSSLDLYHNLQTVDWQNYNAENDKYVDELSKRLEGIGFRVSPDELKSVFASYPKNTFFDDTYSSSRATPCERLTSALRWIYDKGVGIVKAGRDLSGSNLYNYAKEDFAEIAKVLSPLSKGEAEERIISRDKSLSTNITPNALHQLVDLISNVRNLSKEEFEKQLMQSFGQFEGMGIGYGDDLRMTGWLADMCYPKRREVTDYWIGSEPHKTTQEYYSWKPEYFRLIDMADSNKTDYADLSEVQHLINSYVMYARAGQTRTDPWAGRAYEVPIQADYETAYNFIVAPSYTREELVENLAQEVECEIQRRAAIRERKANDPKDPNAELSRAQLLGYEKRGQEFQIFPELNTNGFINRYYATNSTLEARELVRQEVDKQLAKLLEAERNRITELGMFSDENKSMLGNVSDSSINDWILNSFYARQQMTKLMYGGLEHFKSIADFEKRNMYAHAQRLPLYTEATYKGEHVGKEYQRVVYLSDDESRSAIYDKICSIADKLEREKKISKDQCKRMKEAYKEITSTDGQGIRTLDSMRSIKIMSGIWTDEDEQAYKNIKNGNYTPDDAQHFMVGIKPVYTGYEIIPAENGANQKPIRVPILHKYSEMVLLPEMLEGLNQQNDSVPFKALNRINKALGKDRQIDLFVFGSGVKVGGHSLINAFAKDEDGNRILKDADSIADFTLNKLNSGNFWVHNLPLKYYGITSSMHADVEDKAIAWASQAEKEAWANILPEDKIILPSGKPMSSLEARELYNKIKTARVIDAFKEVRKIFYSPHKMATLMKEELASKPYQSREMAFYLQVLDSGNNSLDLFSPNIQHDAVALLSSILKKRLTKFPTKGANITQTSGFGLDTEMVTNSFDDRGALKESDKLGIKTDKQGHTYVEAYVPIYDSRLEQFADSNGNITADRLDDLVKRGIIPESCLYFIGYRTPSDAEHSIIPCKIKGFIANTAGASIRLPKEIMVMTGHDYDGDKMRCHFKDFYVGWNDQKIRKDYEKFSDSEAIKDILDDSREVVVTPYEVFRKNAIADTNPEANKYRIVKEVKYDYEKTPLENIGEDNDYRALNNALVDLMFSQLSSPTGIEKMMIPGGSTETTIYARTMQIMHAFGTTEGKAAIKKALKENKLSDEQIESKTKNTIALYNYLIERGEKELTSIVNAVEGNSSPFTVSHASEAQNYMMSGAKMIGVYAVYNSASAMFQRLNLHYIPQARRFGENKGEPVRVSLFNKPIDKLFAVEKNKPIPTLGLARLVNAAVDNGKNPVLGHLNQTAELAPLTNFLFAAGLSEEEVHLLLNQPAVIELGNKMKGSDSPSFTVAANSVIRAIQGTMKDGAGRYSWETSVEKVSAMPKEMFIESLSTSFADLLSGNDTLRKSNQIHILQTLEHIYGAVSDLDQFSKLTRPESNSGGIDSTLGGIVAKLFQLNDFREKVSSGNCNISGVNGVIEQKEILYNVMTPKMIEERIGDELPEVTVLNTLLKDNAPKLFWQWFPQVRNSWRRVAKSIADLYSYQNVPGKVIERIQSDMLLWKLLSSTEFIEGDPQEEQKRIIEETPKRLKELKVRILEASNNPGKDPLADLLSTNLFLNNLEIGSTINANNEEIERIRFKQNGPAVEDTADLIRAGWDELYRYADTYQLALDLFKYNLYTNGFSYGRYEFAHYAPYSIVRDTPGYQKALGSLLRSGWSEEEENQFIHQYCRNHWGDKNFLVKIGEDKLPINIRQMIGIEMPSRTMMKPSDFETSVSKYPYIIIPTKKKQKEYITQVTYNWQDGKQERQIELSDDEDKLYEIIRDDSGKIVDMKEAHKLGLRNHSNQVMVQYNPRVRDYRELRPIFKSNDVAWESKKSLSAVQADDQSGQPAVDEVARQNAIDDIPFGIPIPTGESVASLQEQAAKAAADNDGKFTAEQAAMLGFKDEEADNNSLYSLTKKVKNGEISFKRDVGERLPFTEDISAAHAAATILIRRHERTDETKRRNLAEQYEVDAKAGKTASRPNSAELSLVERDSEGKPVRKQYPATPRVVSEARRQKAFAELNKRLREILQKHGVSIGSLYESEARMMAAGVSDFSSAKVLAEGMKELIRLANGIEGEYALPEEFAHVAIEMLGHDHPLVSRLLTALSNNEKALEEAYDGMLDAYREQYGNDHDKLVLEAAGKLVAKQLFKHQLAKTNSIRNLVTRICNAIKDFFRRFSTREIDEAILDSEGIASQLARELVSGKLADEMSLEKITSNGKFFSVDKNLTDKQDLMSKLLKRTVKLKDVLSRRVKYSLAHGATNRSLEETENQIAKLEAAIQNQKLETAVVDYLKDAMSFMSEMEKSLDDAINNRPANAVCKKLQITKDTLFGFAGVIEDVRDAISNGEIQDDADLKTALRDVSYQIEDFWDKYNRISLLYFEKFLSNVYGEDGLTVTVGRNKGKKITIHEMATKADHDVSFLGRMLHAASDINDYVLQAVDRVTRDAKFNARSRVRSLRPRFEAAFEALIKEQGNRNQSWMFERDSNGNLTGKYITQAKANTLSDARKNFYNVFMELKTMADNCVPDAMITNSKTGLKEHRRIIMMRKEHYEKMKSAKGISEKGAEEWDSIKNSVLEMSDDLDVENEQVITDFAGNKVDMLPLKFLNKGKKESFNDMTEDTASSLMAYLGMAFEYQEMNNVIGLLENARYMSSRRDVAQKSGSRNKIEDVGNEEEFHYRKPFTVKQARSNLQKAIDDFYQMHVYGHLRKDEGTFGKTRISKRKAADTLNRFASLSQMALNLQQRIANVNTGFTQILVESAGGKIKAKDVAWASGLWMAQSADRMAETGKTDYNNKLSLWMDYFDVHQDNGREVKLTKYSRTRGSRVFNEGLLYAGLTVGEDFMAGTTALALARTYKLKGPDGKESNMWDAYEVKYADSKNKTGAYLSLKNGYTKQDGSAITQEDEKKFMREVIGTNFELQGIYNTDDRSAIQQYSLGSLAIMYRKWIAPALKRRYAGVHYSNLKGDFQEGYYSTAFRLLGDDLKDIFKPVSEEESNKTIMQILTDFNAMKTSINLNWNKLNDYEKGNIKKAMTELAVTACLVIASALLTNLPDDDDDNKFVAWAEDIAITQLLRLRSEVGSQAPTPMLAGEALRIMSSPFAALKPIKDSLNIFQLMWIPNYHEEVKSGRYKGRTRAHKYFMSLPIVSMFRKFDNFVDPTPLINYYRNQNY